MSKNTPAQLASKKISTRIINGAPCVCEECLRQIIETEYSQDKRIVEAAKAYVAAELKSDALCTSSSGEASQAHYATIDALEALRAAVQGSQSK